MGLLEAHFALNNKFLILVNEFSRLLFINSFASSSFCRSRFSRCMVGAFFLGEGDRTPNLGSLVLAILAAYTALSSGFNLEIGPSV